jgi:hypothetical protein
MMITNTMNSFKDITRVVKVHHRGFPKPEIASQFLDVTKMSQFLDVIKVLSK